MSDASLGPIGLALLLAGTVLMLDDLRLGLLRAGLTGIAVGFWYLAWDQGARAGASLVEGLQRVGIGQDAPVVANLAFATAAWLCVVLAAWLFLGRYRAAWTVRPFAPGMLAVLGWVAILILPHLGQGGVWPAGSIVLAAWIAILAVALVPASGT